MSSINSNQIVNLTAPLVQRVANTVRAYEQAAPRRDIRKPWKPDPLKDFYARIVAENPCQPGNYSWIRQTIQNGLLIDDATLPNSPPTGTFPAAETNGRIDIEPDTKVAMSYAGNDANGNPRYLFTYGGAGLVLVALQADGGGSTYFDPPTYSLYTLEGTLLSTQTPLSTPRPIAGDLNIDSATLGYAYNVAPGETNPLFVMGMPPTGVICGSGSGSGSGSGLTTNTVVLIQAFEQYYASSGCQFPAGSGSGSGSGEGG